MPESKNDITIFAGSSGRQFARRMCDYLNIPLGKSEVLTFSDGNIFVKVGENVRSKDVYLVLPIALNPNDEFTELLFWMDAFKRASVNSVTAIIPYFGYAKGDKKDEPRVSIRARVCAECIELAGADRVMTMDLHSPQIQGFFKKPVDHLYALQVLAEHVKRMDYRDFVVVSPDSGFTKNARKFANCLGAPLAIADKMRTSHDENAEVLQLIGDVQGKNTLVVDDFSISGGTLISLANLLKERGANTIVTCLSHVLLNEQAVKKIEASRIDLLVSTDSVENPHVRDSSKIDIVSVSPLFAEAVARINRKDSISELFERVPQTVFDASVQKTDEKPADRSSKVVFASLRSNDMRDDNVWGAK